MDFNDAVRIARGCLDYGGGYRDSEQRDIFHHGIQTVINALECAAKNGLNDTQVRALHNIGRDYITTSYSCNGSPKGCERQRFGGCDYCDGREAAGLTANVNRNELMPH